MNLIRGYKHDLYITEMKKIVLQKQKNYKTKIVENVSI